MFLRHSTRLLLGRLPQLRQHSKDTCDCILLVEVEDVYKFSHLTFSRTKRPRRLRRAPEAPPCTPATSLCAHHQGCERDVDHQQVTSYHALKGQGVRCQRGRAAAAQLTGEKWGATRLDSSFRLLISSVSPPCRKIIFCINKFIKLTYSRMEITGIAWHFAKQNCHCCVSRRRRKLLRQFSPSTTTAQTPYYLHHCIFNLHNYSAMLFKIYM